MKIEDGNKVFPAIFKEWKKMTTKKQGYSRPFNREEAVNAIKALATLVYLISDEDILEVALTQAGDAEEFCDGLEERCDEDLMHDFEFLNRVLWRAYKDGDCAENTLFF